MKISRGDRFCLQSNNYYTTVQRKLALRIICLANLNRFILEIKDTEFHLLCNAYYYNHLALLYLKREGSKYLNY